MYFLDSSWLYSFLQQFTLFIMGLLFCWIAHFHFSPLLFSCVTLVALMKFIFFSHGSCAWYFHCSKPVPSVPSDVFCSAALTVMNSFSRYSFLVSLFLHQFQKLTAENSNLGGWLFTLRIWSILVYNYEFQGV